MASLTIRNLDSQVKAQLRQMAAQHGRSMEAEARAILSKIMQLPSGDRSLAETIHRRFETLGIETLPIPTRQEIRNPPEFGK